MGDERLKYDNNKISIVEKLYVIKKHIDDDENGKTKTFYPGDEYFDSGLTKMWALQDGYCVLTPLKNKSEIKYLAERLKECDLIIKTFNGKLNPIKRERLVLTKLIERLVNEKH